MDDLKLSFGKNRVKMLFDPQFIQVQHIIDTITHFTRADFTRIAGWWQLHVQS